MTDVYMNGALVGHVENPVKFKETVLQARREGKISGVLNLRYIESQDVIDVAIDKNRVRRPLIIVKSGKPLLTKELVEKIEKGEISWTDLLKEGVIEYLDALEEENALVALHEDDLTNEHTHLEINPLAIFGTTTSEVPYANFNSSSRLNRGSKTQKQAVGMYALNYTNRTDTNANVLYYPQNPIVKTITHDIFNKQSFGGQNVVIAILNYDGYNMQDAMVLNKASLQRGFGRLVHYRPYIAEKIRYPGGQVDDLLVPDKDLQGYTLERDYRYLETDGLIYPEAAIEGGDVLVGRSSPPRFLGKVESFSAAANIRKDTSVRTRFGETGVVSKVLITESQDGNPLIKVDVRETRIPETGDKFSSRHGQKGIVGFVVPAKDLPFTASGIVPDVIFSPNGLPKRMTVAHIMEMLGGKVGALAGRTIDGTPFQGEKSENLRDELLKLGFRDDGLETLYDGKTGKQYHARIFVGNIYYLRLKHQVADKIQARGRGPVQLLTRQPTEGKSKEGGLRLGEMEKDALIAHGASLLMKERFDSDKTTVYVCERCGDVAMYDDYKNKATCLSCGEKTPTSPIEMSYVFKLFLDELKSMGIRPKLKLEEKY